MQIKTQHTYSGTPAQKEAAYCFQLNLSTEEAAEFLRDHPRRDYFLSCLIGYYGLDSEGLPKNPVARLYWLTSEEYAQACEAGWSEEFEEYWSGQE